MVNLQAAYRITKRAELFGRVQNLLDKRYATAGFLTTSAFNANGTFIPNPANWTNQNAVSPAPPRGIWVGARFRW